MTKCLLTIVTSPHCLVHEASLLTSVRASFHVYLVSKSQGVKERSKVALTQMLATVFSRMENAERRGPPNTSTQSLSEEVRAQLPFPS